MNLDDIKAICSNLPKVTEGIKWENHLCFMVGEKMFMIIGLDEHPITASFKAHDEDFESLVSREGFQPAPYLARYKWVHVNDISLLKKDEGADLIKMAYTLVKDKLPRKKRIELGLASQ